MSVLNSFIVQLSKIFCIVPPFSSLHIAWWELHADERVDHSYHNIHTGAKQSILCFCIASPLLFVSLSLLKYLSVPLIVHALLAAFYVSRVLCQRDTWILRGRHKGFRDIIVLTLIVLLVGPFTLSIPTFVISLHLHETNHRDGGEHTQWLTGDAVPRGKPLNRNAMLLPFFLILCFAAVFRALYTAFAVCAVVLVWRFIGNTFYLHLHQWFVGLLLMTASSSDHSSVASLGFAMLVEGSTRWSFAPLYHLRKATKGEVKGKGRGGR